LVAGGGAGAAWKAELLAASGASVTVLASDLDPEMAALVERGSIAGSIALVRRRWSADDLSGTAIAVCEGESDEDASAFQHACRSAGVPCNVIDKPEFCDFFFGSIVNRSPAVVAISTDGAAPILGQAIRRRIETLLPPALADWAALAHELRAAVTRLLAAGPQRRVFWERLVDRAFGAAPDVGAAETLIAEAESIAANVNVTQGRVTLVGAGPGDAELLTLKAVRALQSADVILSLWVLHELAGAYDGERWPTIVALLVILASPWTSQAALVSGLALTGLVATKLALRHRRPAPTTYEAGFR
jgi:uroporphyrin-III C-methyltransferase/precorrin-2 dehydrogenase/sirohydrochlorin ferrochelatase